MNILDTKKLQGLSRRFFAKSLGQSLQFFVSYRFSSMFFRFFHQESAQRGLLPLDFADNTRICLLLLLFFLDGNAAMRPRQTATLVFSIRKPHFRLLLQFVKPKDCSKPIVYIKISAVTRIPEWSY